MKLNMAQIIVIIVFGLILLLVAVPNLIYGYWRIYKGCIFIAGVGIFGVYLARERKKSN